MSFDSSTVISVVSAATAVISAATAISALVISFSKNKGDAELAMTKWKKEYFADMRQWSDNCLMSLSDALHLCDLDPKRGEPGSFYERRHRLLVELSAQIDKGRWFFPNYALDQHGQNKEEAYRGYRHEVLDALVFSYDALTDVDYYERLKNIEQRWRRNFGQGR
jgi:hypothetical protein